MFYAWNRNFIPLILWQDTTNGKNNVGKQFSTTETEMSCHLLGELEQVGELALI